MLLHWGLRAVVAVDIVRKERLKGVTQPSVLVMGQGSSYSEPTGSDWDWNGKKRQSRERRHELEMGKIQACPPALGD